MIDKLLTRVMPALFIIALALLMIPHTSAPILRYLSDWVLGRGR